MYQKILLLFIFCSSFLYGQEAQLILKTKSETKTYNFSEIGKITFVPCILTSVDEKDTFSNLPSKITFIKNYPNPFNNSTNIEFEMGKAGNVEIQIFDQYGNLIRNISKMATARGTQNLNWDAKDNSGKTVNSGSYYCQVRFESRIISNKMIFIK